MIDAHAHSICLYRRSSGRHWWWVDAHVTTAGAVVIISGDANEWTARIEPEHATTLLRALRRTGDLAASIGTTQPVEILHRLRNRFYRAPDAPRGAFEEIRTFLDDNRIPWQNFFWASDTDGEQSAGSAPVQRRLSETLAELRGLLARPDNDFTWSGWEDRKAALAELDALIDQDEPALATASTIRLLLAPAGPVQEVALASGWSSQFLALAQDIERALAPPATDKRRQ